MQTDFTVKCSINILPKNMFIYRSNAFQERDALFRKNANTAGFTSHHWQTYASGVQIYSQLCSGFRPKRKFSVAREDHQANLLSFGDDLIVGLKLKGQGIELTGHQGFTFGKRTMVLWIGPATPRDLRQACS